MSFFFLCKIYAQSKSTLWLVYSRFSSLFLCPANRFNNFIYLTMSSSFVSSTQIGMQMHIHSLLNHNSRHRFCGALSYRLVEVDNSCIATLKTGEKNMKLETFPTLASHTEKLKLLLSRLMMLLRM